MIRDAPLVFLTKKAFAEGFSSRTSPRTADAAALDETEGVSPWAGSITKSSRWLAATGIAGLSLGIVLLRYERPIREKFFLEMQPHQASAQLRLNTFAVWAAGVIGLSTALYALWAEPG
jgi:hypothetical protein